MSPFAGDGGGDDGTAAAAKSMESQCPLHQEQTRWAFLLGLFSAMRRFIMVEG